MSFFRIEQAEDEREARHEAIDNLVAEWLEQPADEILDKAGTRLRDEVIEALNERAGAELDRRTDEARLDHYMAQRGL